MKLMYELAMIPLRVFRAVVTEPVCIAILLWLVAIATCCGADVKVEQQQTGNKQLIILTAAGSDAAGVGCIWDVFPSEGVEADETPGKFVFTAPPGKYVVKLRAILWDKKQTVTAVWQGSIGPAAPPKPPDPPPQPLPSGHVKFAYAVYDPATVTAADAATLDPARWATLTGIGWHVYKVTDAMPGNLLARASSAGGLPAVVLCSDVGADGTAAFLRAVRLPASFDLLKQELAK